MTKAIPSQISIKMVLKTNTVKESKNKLITEFLI